MEMMFTKNTLVFVAAAGLALVDPAIAFNNPPGVKVCDESFNPGGQFVAPVTSSVPLLDLTIRPRMNLYIDSETSGSFIIDAPISFTNGGVYTGSNPSSEILVVSVTVADSGLMLVSNKSIEVNSTANEVSFSLAKLSPQIDPYTVAMTACPSSNSSNSSSSSQGCYEGSADLIYLPTRSDGGSTVKLDSLYGGLLVQDISSNSSSSVAAPFTPLFPYSYYVQWSWLSTSVSNLDLFQAEGYNMIHIVADGDAANQAFNFTQLLPFLERCDSLGLRLMYDMRYTYQNLSSVREQVSFVTAHPSLLLWYTGDEPDGATDPLNATAITYAAIKARDPYHPVSLCLNCADFYYAEYAAGADLVLADPYMVGNNVTFSGQYHTVCNATYGDCGCDDCDGVFEDVSARLDSYARYHQEGGGGAPNGKPTWSVPQGFGAEEFWLRWPTSQEEAVNAMISVNHNAKGIVAWTYPTEPQINATTSALAKILAAPDVASLLLGSPIAMALPVAGGNSSGSSDVVSRLDVSAWTSSATNGTMLVSIVNPSYSNSSSGGSGSAVTVTLPQGVAALEQTLYGSGEWTVLAGGDGDVIQKTGAVEALEVDLLMFSLKM